MIPNKKKSAAAKVMCPMEDEMGKKPQNSSYHRGSRNVQPRKSYSYGGSRKHSRQSDVPIEDQGHKICNSQVTIEDQVIYSRKSHIPMEDQRNIAAKVKFSSRI